MIMYLLDKQQTIIKALDETIVEANMIEEINTANKLAFSVMTNSRIDENIHYVCILAPKGEEFLLFKLISETVKNDRVEYTAVESAYDELKSYAYIKDVRPQDKTAGEMLTQILQGTRWSLGHIADTVRASTNFYYITVLEAIQKIVELFNVELTFTVNIDKKTNVISSRRINLYTQQGRRLGKRFEYGSNLLEVTREQSSEDLITALVGRGKGEEVSQGEDGSPDGYGRRITFADIEWKKANGNPADKPKGQEYVEDKAATALYGFSDGKPRIGLTTFEDITDPQELLKATWASLQVAKRPKVSFKSNVLDVGVLGLGDTVAIIRHDLGIEYFTRVYKVDHDLLDKNNNTIELGDDFSQKSLTNYVSDVAKITENAKNTAEYAASSANGKNKNYYSKSKPQYANEGDNLFLDLGNGETEYYIWHDGNWELVLSTADTTRIQKQVEEAQRDIADARAEADRLSQEQSKTAKELSDKITDISDKAIKNASDIKSVTDDIANVHADYVSQQAKLNQQKQDLEQTRQDLLSNSNRLDKLTVDLDSVNINVNNVNSKIDNIKIGGTNLMRNTTRDYIKFTGDGWGVSYLTPNNQAIDVPVIGSETYTFSAWVKNDSSSAGRIDLEIYQYNAKGENKQNGSSSEISAWVSPGEEKRLVFTKTLLADTTIVRLHTRNRDNNGTVTYWTKMAKVEKGNIPADWSPAPEDEIERVSQLKVDLNGMNATVATNKGDIAQIKLTENGMQQSIKDAQGNISTLQNDSKQFKQQFQNVNGSIATITNTANSLSSQLSTKVGTSEYNSFKNQTAQELRTKLTASDLSGYAKSADVKVSVDGLNARFDNLNVGGTNLLKGTSKELKQVTTTNDWVRLPYGTNFFKSIYPLDNFTAKVWIENPDKDSWLQAYVGGNGVFVGNIIKAGQSGYSIVHGTLNKNVTSANLVIGAGDGVSVSLGYKELQLEKGTIATDWSPAPEDMTDKIEILSGKVTANSNEFSTVYTKITNAKNDAINAIKGDSQWQSMGKIVTNASFLQNSDGFAQEVVRTATPMIEGGGTNLVRNSAHDPINLEHWTTNGVGRVFYATHLFFRNNTTKMFFLDNKTNQEMAIQTEYIDIEPDTNYTLSMVVFGASGVSSGDVYYNIKYKDGSNAYFAVDGRFKYNPNKPERKVYRFHTSPNSSGSPATQIFIRVDNNGLMSGYSDGTSMLGDVKLEKGTVATPWSPSPEDLATKLQLNQVIDTADSHTRTITDYLTGSNSRFTQLSNNVNLKVNKGDVIGQINLEAGRTLLQNKKIYLDADTVDFSGKAFIPSAAIQNLDAGKITTGTLDAANVNVINLNANNITSGTIKGQNLSMNLNTGVVDFQKGRIRSTTGTLDIDIDRGTLQISNDSGEGIFSSDGRLEFSSKTNWGGNLPPQYGKIYRTVEFLTGVAEGITIEGAEGVEIKTSNYNGWGAPTISGTPNGAGLTMANNGKVIFESGGPLQLIAGDSNNLTRPSITIGTNTWTDKGSDNERGQNVSIVGNGVYICPTGETIIGVGGLTVEGRLGVQGAKNSIVDTSQGKTAINAYETAEYYFGDIAKTNTGASKRVKIMIDPIFLETINTDINYHVFVSSYDNGYAWVSEMAKDYFVIESNVPNLNVSYEIKAKRKQYENVRLDKVDMNLTGGKN